MSAILRAAIRIAEIVLPKLPFWRCDLMGSATVGSRPTKR